jgi:hypothetical protein
MNSSYTTATGIGTASASATSADQPFVFPFKASTWGYVKTLLHEGPNFQIWIGNGGNGKSTLLSAVAERCPSRFIRFISPRDLLRCRFKNHILAVDEWDDDFKIPGAVIQRLMELGNLVILVTNTYPILVNPTHAVFEQTHVVPFTKHFVDRNPNAVMKPTWAPKRTLDDAQARYMRLLDTDSAPQHVEPAECAEAKKQLRLLAEFTSVDWPSTAPTPFVAPTLTIKEEPQPTHPAKMDVCTKNKVTMNKNKNTVECFNLPRPVTAEPVLPTVIPAVVQKQEQEQEQEQEQATDDDAEGPVPAYADITAILIHTDPSRPDDSLTIRVDPYSDGFYVTLDQNYLGSHCTSYFGVNDLAGYLNSFFRCLDADADGYSYIQFAAPLFPAVVVKRRNAIGYLNTQLIPQIGFLLTDWPTDEVVRGPWRSGPTE